MLVLNETSLILSVILAHRTLLEVEDVRIKIQRLVNKLLK